MRPLRHVLLLVGALGALCAVSGPAEPARAFSCPGVAFADVRDGAVGLDGGAPVRVSAFLLADDNPPKPKKFATASSIPEPLAARVAARRAARTEPGLSHQTTYLVTRRLRV